jgi:hypothetical protein
LALLETGIVEVSDSEDGRWRPRWRDTPSAGTGGDYWNRKLKSEWNRRESGDDNGLIGFNDFDLKFGTVVGSLRMQTILGRAMAAMPILMARLLMASRVVARRNRALLH